MKKLLIIPLIASLFFLSGCFGGDETDENTETPVDEPRIESNNNFDGGEFTLNIPEEWEIIEKKDFTSDIPNGTEIVIKNNIKNPLFTANANVTKNSLTSIVSSKDYALQAASNLKTSLLNFREMNREDVKVLVDGREVDTLYMAFEGKQDQYGNPVQFLQTYAVKGHFGYIVTGAFAPSEEELVVKKVDDIVRSLEVK
ncbi:MAG: hypothetical protein ABH856_01520 [Patescibacteria group bacterium]|nr:hypothetical protein [Patescibacteria group bacterium]